MSQRNTDDRMKGPRRRWDGGPLGALDALFGWPFSSATAPDWRRGSRDRKILAVLVALILASIWSAILLGGSS